jgi:hypothetical protein
MRPPLRSAAVTHRRLALLAFLAPLAMPTRGAWAQASDRVQVEGQWFDKRAEVAGTPLRLNGTGVRAVAWFKGFVAGLYLTGEAGSAGQAVALPGPKRVQMRMLHEVPAGELSKAVRKGVNRNSTPAEQAAFVKRLEQFETEVAVVKSVRAGDVIDLDLEPGRGLQIRVNGKPRGGPIAGEDFYAAVLKSFVGDRPYDEKLKAGLLGRPA